MTRGIYQDLQTKTVLKEVQPPPKGEREVEFYKKVSMVFSSKSKKLSDYSINKLFYPTTEIILP